MLLWTQLSHWVAFKALKGPPSLRAVTFPGATSQLRDTRSDRETT